MILDRLELRNFKRFRDCTVEFKDGITGILGNNGTGKSSLVQAIFFALYGVKGTGIPAEYIVSSFASPKEKCEVILDFRIGGDTYKIIRTFRKGKTVSHDAEFYMNRKLVAREVSPVEDALKRTLGMGPVDFKNTIYAGQKDLLTLLENTPGKRKEWFQKALGIDYLNTESQKILKEEIDIKDGELRGKEGELTAMANRQRETDPAGLQVSVALFTEAIAGHGKAKELLRQQREGLEAEGRRLSEQKIAYNRLLQQQQALRQERDADMLAAKKIEAGLALLADEEAEYHRIEKTAGSYEDVKGRLDALREKKIEHLRLTGDQKAVTREVADLAARAERQQATIAALGEDERKKAELARQVRAGLSATQEIADDRLEGAVSYRLAEIGKRAGALAARLAQYTEERGKIEADATTIRTAGADGVCPLCRQKLGEHFGSIEAEFAAQCRALEEKAVADLERQEQLAKEKAAIESLRPALDTLRSIDGRLRQKAACNEELALLAAARAKKVQEQQAIAASLERLGYNDEAYQACERESAGLQQVQRRFIELGKKIGQGLMARQHLAELTGKIAGREKELAAIDGEIAGAAFDPAAAARIDAALAENDAGLRNEEIAIANATKDRETTERQIADYKRADEQIAALKAQAAALGEEIALLKLTRSLIGEYVICLMQVVRNRIEGEVSRIIGEITGGRYDQVLLDEDFNLLVRDVDDDYAIDRFSGGEQDDIAVALRIALSRYLAELHNVHESTFLIFDEIFGSQDEERRSNLLTALRTQESRFPQILLISHIEEIQGEFATTLKVEMGTDNASRIREVT